MARMHIQKGHLSRHRRQRLALWALTMLSWIAAVLISGRALDRRQLRQRHHRVSLQGLTRMVIDLAIVRAAELGRWRRRSGRVCVFRRGRDMKRRHFHRSLLGARLRRVLRSKDVAARIAKLIAVLRNLDAFARALSRRRLSRLWGPRITSREHGLAVAITAPRASMGALLDSS
jgi:hypothetical protein